MSSMTVLIIGSFSVFIGLLLLELAKVALTRYLARPKPLVIEIEKFNPDFLEGWGFVVEGRVILDYDQTPLLFKKKTDAAVCLRDKYENSGDLVYQRWDTKTRKVYVGEVQKRGTNQ